MSQNLFVEYYKSKEKKAFDVYSINFNEKKSSNIFLLNLWKKKLRIVPYYRGNFFNLIESYCFKILSNDIHSIPRFKIKDHNLMLTKKPIFKTEKIFNLQETKKILKKYNLPKNARWICINNRDELYDKLNKDKYLRQSIKRNFSINVYNKMILKAIKDGFYIIRLGVLAKEEVSIKSDKIIDLPFDNKREPKDDIFFISRCYLYFGADSGPWTLAAMLGKKIAFVNHTEIFFLIENLYSLKIPFLPSLAISKKPSKLLKFKDYKKNKIYRSKFNDSILRPNTSFLHHGDTDVYNYFIEVIDIIKNRKTYSYNGYQKSFFKNFLIDNCHESFSNKKLRVSNIFLKKYKELLY